MNSKRLSKLLIHLEELAIQPSYLRVNHSNFNKSSKFTRMTEFCIGEIVGFRNDEKTKSYIKRFYGQEHAENNVIFSLQYFVSCIIRVILLFSRLSAKLVVC